MDPTNVKEPVVAAEAELKAIAMNAAANLQSLGPTISRPDRWMGANGSNFIEPAFHDTERSDNGTSVPPWDSRTVFTIFRKETANHAKSFQPQENSMKTGSPKF
jgi:hypothetical protein